MANYSRYLINPKNTNELLTPWTHSAGALLMLPVLRLQLIHSDGAFTATRARKEVVSNATYDNNHSSDIDGVGLGTIEKYSNSSAD